MLNALKFLLDHLIKNGDAHVSAQAARHKQMLEEENAPVAEVQTYLPHQGVQSPFPKSEDGLGGTEDDDKI